MPVGFICLGIISLYTLFFSLDRKNTAFIIFLCVLSMVGFLFDKVCFPTFSINIFFIASAVILLVYSSLITKGHNILWPLILSVFVGITYFILTKLNSDFITSFNPIPVVIAISILGLILVNKKYSLLSYFSLSLLVISILDLFIEKGFGYSNLTDTTFVSLSVLSLAILMLINLLLQKKKERKSYEN